MQNNGKKSWTKLPDKRPKQNFPLSKKDQNTTLNIKKEPFLHIKQAKTFLVLRAVVTALSHKPINQNSKQKFVQKILRQWFWYLQNTEETAFKQSFEIKSLKDRIWHRDNILAIISKIMKKS